MIFQIPQKTIPNQANIGETFGDFWASWNLDLLSNPGKIRVSPQTQVLMSSDTGFSGGDADLGLPVAFLRSAADGTDVIWAATSTGLFKTISAANLVSWHQDGLASSPTSLADGTDMTEFNGALIVSSDTNLYRLSSTWNATWLTGTLASAALKSGVPHPLCTSFNNFLLIGNGTAVISVNVSNTVDTAAIGIGKEYEITWIKSSNSTVFIGARNKIGGKAKVFSWDGYSENFNQDYKLNGQYALSGIIKDEIPYAIDETGQLLKWNGAGFTQIAVFPNFLTRQDFNVTTTYKYWHNNMGVADNDIYILLGGGLTGTSSGASYGLENMRHGLWRYNENTGLHHAYSLTKDIGSGVVDYGSPAISNPGALYYMPRIQGPFLIGASIVPNSAGSAKYYILNARELESETTSKIGYFITPKFQTKDVEEVWQKLYILIKKFLNSTDKIVVKYRTDKTTLIEEPSTCIWQTATNFTTTADWSGVSVGNEVEILEGEGSGLSAHISSINTGAGSYYIVLDESVADASGSTKNVVWNWTKVGTTVSTQDQRRFEIPVGQTSSWIQFKVMMWWQGKNEMEKIFIKSEPQVKVL